MNSYTSESQKHTARLAALQYAAQGWKVLPLHTILSDKCSCNRKKCTSPAKHPLTPKGVWDASTAPEQIEQWWKETGGMANVGIATGEQSGIVVLDVDAKSGGLESLKQMLEGHSEFPETPTVVTGGGGRHFFFNYPVGEKLGNRTGVLPGIDVRSDGGYVVAPPSKHISGADYQWTTPCDVPVAEMPAWLLQTVLRKPNSDGLKLTIQDDADLTNHPGVGEGQRNAKLCQLVGMHLARGEAASKVEALALAWADRCSPALEHEQVIRTVRSLAEKHSQKSLFVNTNEESDGESFFVSSYPPKADDQTFFVSSYALDSDIDALPLPEPPPWPVLNESAMHGLAGKVVHAIEPSTEADPAAILVSLLTLFGNAIGRSAYFPVEGDKHHANLFSVLVGDSARGRKGTSLGRSKSLFEQADGEWLKDRLTCGLSSGEGLIWAVRDSSEELEPVKEQGKIVGYQQVVRDQGIEDKRLVVVESEFAQPLRVMRREGNTLSPIIRQAWDSGNLRTLTKNSSAVASDVHISILGHITRQELCSYLAQTDIFNGFGNRFLWVLVRRSKLLPDGGKMLDLGPLQQQVAKAAVKAKTIKQMARSPEASKLWHSLYPKLTAERPGLFGAIAGRGEAQTLRLSMLYALLDGSASIESSHLQAAYALWNYCEDSARIIFEHDKETEDPLQKLLLAVIHDHPGISRTGLHDATGRNLSAEAIVGALGALRDRKLVCCKTAATKGRPAEQWFPAEPEEAETPAYELTKKGEPAVSDYEETKKDESGADGGDYELTKKVQSDDADGYELTKKAEAQADEEAYEVTKKVPEPPDGVMSIAELFSFLNQIGGRLAVYRGEIRVKAPNEHLSTGLMMAIAVHREALIELLGESSTTTTGQVDAAIEDSFIAELLSCEESC